MWNDLRSVWDFLERFIIANYLCSAMHFFERQYIHVLLHLEKPMVLYSGAPDRFSVNWLRAILDSFELNKLSFFHTSEKQVMFIIQWCKGSPILAKSAFFNSTRWFFLSSNHCISLLKLSKTLIEAERDWKSSNDHDQLRATISNISYKLSVATSQSSDSYRGILIYWSLWGIKVSQLFFSYCNWNNKVTLASAGKLTKVLAKCSTEAGAWRRDPSNVQRCK